MLEDSENPKTLPSDEEMKRMVKIHKMVEAISEWANTWKRTDVWEYIYDLQFIDYVYAYFVRKHPLVKAPRSVDESSSFDRELVDHDDNDSDSEFEHVFERMYVLDQIECWYPPPSYDRSRRVRPHKYIKSRILELADILKNAFQPERPLSDTIQATNHNNSRTLRAVDTYERSFLIKGCVHSLYELLTANWAQVNRIFNKIINTDIGRYEYLSVPIVRCIVRPGIM